jgi:succinate-acetate transporter protein
MLNIHLNLFTLPIWWYTDGLKILWEFNKLHFSYGLRATGISMFVRHMNEPLYQDYSKSGMVLSLILRFFLLLYKIFLLFIRIAILAILDAIYLFWLPLSITFLILQIIPVK